jgi:hypothetical protein
MAAADSMASAITAASAAKKVAGVAAIPRWRGSQVATAVDSAANAARDSPPWTGLALLLCSFWGNYHRKNM